jgi:hypothetical protein
LTLERIAKSKPFRHPLDSKVRRPDSPKQLHAATKFRDYRWLMEART